MSKKVSIITGASSGIGKALAFELTRRGYITVLVARRLEHLNEISDQIQSLYQTRPTVIQADLSQQSECKYVVEKTLEIHQQIDVLINNAGISQRAMFADLDLSVIKKVMDINFWGSVNMTKFAIPALLKTNGSVVAVSSISGYVPLPARTGYCSSKYAIHGFMESLRLEHLKTGLHVMVVAPEYVASEIREKALMGDGSQQITSPREEKRMLTAEYVAKRIAIGIHKRKRTLIIGTVGKLTVWFTRNLPRLTDRLIYTYIKREHNSPF